MRIIETIITLNPKPKEIAGRFEGAISGNIVKEIPRELHGISKKML